MKHILFNRIGFTAFDLKLLNNIVDVFLAKTYDYDKCVHLNHQIEMKNTSPIDKMVIKCTYHTNFYLFLLFCYKYFKNFELVSTPVIFHIYNSN